MLSIKKTLTFTKQKQLIAKCSIFDLPALIFYQDYFDHFSFTAGHETTGKKGAGSQQMALRDKVSFVEFKKNRGNFQFMKDFNTWNDN